MQVSSATSYTKLACGLGGNGCGEQGWWGPPPPNLLNIAPSFLPGLRPIKNFLWRLWRQFVQTKKFPRRF